MKGDFFRSAEDRILVEQLRLLYGNLGSSVIPAILLALLLLITLANDRNRHELLLWCMAVIASKLYTAIHARRRLAAGIQLHKARQKVTQLMVMHFVYGATWGALAWITLDNTTPSGDILILAVLAGILGNTVALLSPVLPIFMSFMLALALVLGSHLWWMNDPNYDALLLASVLYLISLLGQARNSATVSHSVIALRFENISLMKQANAAQRQAEQANQVKSKFLAAASHDLRQPVHAQGLFLEVLGSTSLTAHQHKVLASARSASLACSEMLNTLLDFSRMEAGVLRSRVKPFDLQILFNKIENDLVPQADAKNLVYRVRDTSLVVNSDASLVEMILRNLVSNAIRYTDRGGILIACRRRGNQAVVEIWDTGIGIHPAHQKGIFREFHQLGNPERDQRKGLGLGLAIAQGLAGILVQDLSLSSRLGSGSVFRLTLPLSSIAVVDEATWTHDARCLQGRHVLAVDDDKAILLGMAQLLRSWGCTVDTADSITEALALAQRQVPDAVISDYRLREHRTGAEAIAALRALLGADLPALLITGDTAPERLRDALANGVPLLHKPVSPDQLFQVMAEIIAPRNISLASYRG